MLLELRPSFAKLLIAFFISVVVTSISPFILMLVSPPLLAMIFGGIFLPGMFLGLFLKAGPVIPLIFQFLYVYVLVSLSPYILRKVIERLRR